MAYPILILHGWGSGAKNWLKVRELLEKEGIQVFLPDLPGFGENPSLEKAWSIDDYVNWIEEYCQKNNLSQFYLLGHSFGGAVALKYALKSPQKIKKLFLVSPALVRLKGFKKELLVKLAKIFKIFSFLPFYALVRKGFYRFIVKSDYLDFEGPMRETYLRVIRDDPSLYLSDLSVPTILIWGEKDEVTPLKDASYLNKKITGSKLEILPKLKHDLQIRAPELLVKKIFENI